jgi:hypothetical protein
VFRGVGLTFRGPTSGRLCCFCGFGFAVPYEMSRFIVVIAVTFNLSLKRLWRFSRFTVLFRSRSYYLIHLVRMAFWFLKYRDMFLFRCHSLCFLRPTPEIIVQAGSLPNQDIPVVREPLNRHRVFDIRTQHLIKLSYLSPFVLIDPGGVLRKPSQVFRYRGILLQLYQLKLRYPDLVEVPVELR